MIHDQEKIIPFSQFMTWASAAYYSSTENIFGKHGDFITAPVLTPLFGEAFSRLFLSIFEASGTASILEIGGGDGSFAKSVLNALAQQNIHGVQYCIFEKSKTLQSRQKKELESFSVEWISELPVQFSGVIFLNEVFDALPVECFQFREHKIIERGVRVQENAYQWADLPFFTEDFKSAEPLLKSIANEQQWENGYTSEWHSASQHFMRDLSATLKNGSIIAVDYGYSERDYYRRERNRGTLMCFYKHQQHENPFLFPGLQDITAHVNFSRLAESGCDHGLELSGYTTQAMCLLGLGIEECAREYAKNLSSKDQLEVLQHLKTLLLPDQMGDRIRVMLFNKSHAFSSPVFHARDLRWEL